MRVYSSSFFDRDAKIYWDDRKRWWILDDTNAPLTEEQHKEVDLITAGKLLRLPKDWQKLNPRKLKAMMRKVNRKIEEQDFRMERLALWASKRLGAKDAVESKVQYLLLKHKAEKCACLYREPRLRGCRVVGHNMGLDPPALQSPYLQYDLCGRCKLRHPETYLLAAKLKGKKVKVNVDNGS